MVFLNQKRNLWQFCSILCVLPFVAMAENPSQQSSPSQQAEKNSPLPPDFLYENKPIDPSCFLGSMESRFNEVSLAVCTQKAKTQWEKGLFQKGKIEGFESFENPTTGDYLYYQHLGTLSSGGHLIYKLNGNLKGTGRFSSIDLVQRAGDKLAFFSIDGGDRANGGISDASFSNGTLKYATSLTPRGLFEFWQIFSTASEASGIDPSTLADCAVCEVAKAYWSIPESALNNLHQVDYLMEISLSSDSKEPLPSQPKTLQECFDIVYAERKAENVKTLSLGDLDGFFEEVISLDRRHR